MGNYISAGYTALRSWSSQVGETSPPTAATFTTTLCNLDYLELLIVNTGLSGNADYIIYEFWRLVDCSNGTQQVENIGKRIVSGFGHNLIQHKLKMGVGKVWVTVRFIGGTAPTVSGTVFVRSSDIVSDPSTTLADYAPLDVVNAGGAGFVSTVYHIPMIYSENKMYRHCTISVVAKSGVANSVKFRLTGSATVAGTIIPASFPANSNFGIITASGLNMCASPIAYLIPDASGDIAVPIATTTYGISLENSGWSSIAVSTTIVSDVNNTLYIAANRFA